MSKYVLVCTILCILVISTPYIISPINSATSIDLSQTNDGSSKNKAIPAQLGDNVGNLVNKQQQMWYSLDSTPGIGYQLNLNGENMLLGIQVIDQNHTTLYKKGPYDNSGTDGFVGKGLVHIIIYDFQGSGTYTLNIKEIEKGQSAVNPVVIGLGSTPVTINSTRQKSFFFHYHNLISDYLSFNLNFNTPGVAIKVALQNTYIKDYNSSIQESLDIPVDFYDGLNIQLNITTDVDVFDLTIVLNRAIGPAGVAPSSAIPMPLGSSLTATVEKDSSSLLEFYNITLPSDDWYMLNITLPSSFGIHEITIYNENYETVYSNGYMFTTINFLQMAAGNYMIKVLSVGGGANLTTTLSQKDPTPGSDQAHAVVVDKSETTFTAVTRYIYMNLTLDPSSYHALKISVDTDVTTSRSIRVIIDVPGQIGRAVDTITDPIFLPKGQSKISVVIDLYYHSKEVPFTISLSDIDGIDYGTQSTALSIDTDTGYTLKMKAAGQQVWVKFLAEKNVLYSVFADAFAAYYKEDGTFLGFANSFVGSGEDIYACFNVINFAEFNFKFEIGNNSDSTAIRYYSQNFKQGDYLEYKTSYTVNGETQDVFPYNVNTVRVNILHNDVVINTNEFSGYYLGYDFARPSPNSVYYNSDPMINLLLLPVHRVTDSYNLESFNLIQQLFSGYKMTEDNQHYYMSNNEIDQIDFSNTTTIYVYDKTNLNLISYSSQRITTDGTIGNQEITLINSKITGHGSGLEATTTTNNRGDAPIKTPFPMEGLVITLIILPILMKKYLKNYR